MNSTVEEQEKRASILLVDQSEKAYAEINQLLKKLKSLRYSLDWAESYQEGMQRLQSGQYNICLLDHAIDNGSGLKFLAAVNELPVKCAVIFLSDGLSIDGDMAALRAGATDYLNKARLLPGILHRAIRFALHRQASSDDTQKLKQKIAQLVRSQAVTEIASGMAGDLATMLVKIDRQILKLSEMVSENSEAIELTKNIRLACKQAYQLAENVAVCTDHASPNVLQSNASSTRKRILVIDNNFNLLEIAKLYLEAANLDNKCFSNPLYAIEWYRQNFSATDGVILDCCSPPLCAADCLSQILAINPHAKVLLCSDRHNFDAKSLIDQGALRYFEKPIGYPSMVSWLAEILKRP